MGDKENSESTINKESKVKLTHPTLHKLLHHFHPPLFQRLWCRRPKQHCSPGGRPQQTIVHKYDGTLTEVWRKLTWEIYVSLRQIGKAAWRKLTSIFDVSLWRKSDVIITLTIAGKLSSLTHISDGNITLLWRKPFSYSWPPMHAVLEWIPPGIGKLVCYMYHTVLLDKRNANLQQSQQK